MLQPTVVVGQLSVLGDTWVPLSLITTFAAFAAPGTARIADSPTRRDTSTSLPAVRIGNSLLATTIVPMNGLKLLGRPMFLRLPTAKQLDDARPPPGSTDKRIE
jgi:hypothetical protein